MNLSEILRKNKIRIGKMKYEYEWVREKNCWNGRRITGVFRESNLRDMSRDRRRKNRRFRRLETSRSPGAQSDGFRGWEGKGEGEGRSLLGLKYLCVSREGVNIGWAHGGAKRRGFGSIVQGQPIREGVGAKILPKMSRASVGWRRSRSI